MSRRRAAAACAPSRRGMARKDGTCLTDGEVRQLMQAHRAESGGGDQPPASSLQRRRGEVVRQLLRAYPQHCGPKTGEACLLENTPLRDRGGAAIAKRALLPKQPPSWRAKPRMWLNTRDIDAVIDQLSHVEGFQFLGVVPLDFQERNASGACIGGPNLCGFKPARDLRPGVQRFGMVLNLDRSHQPGSHWVALYCNLDPRRPNYGIHYYDSVGRPPPPPVQQFMQSVQRAVGDPGFRAAANATRVQFKNTECGIYAMLFLVRCLQEKHGFGDICRTMPDDRGAFKLRRAFYRAAE